MMIQKNKLSNILKKNREKSNVRIYAVKSDDDPKKQVVQYPNPMRTALQKTKVFNIQNAYAVKSDDGEKPTTLKTGTNIDLYREATPQKIDPPKPASAGFKKELPQATRCY